MVISLIMNIIASKHSLSGNITVPGSKSHTIRALILASLAKGKSNIYNPLPSADCYSAANAVPLFGAEVDFTPDGSDCEKLHWTVTGSENGLHLPDNIVNVGNSGSLLYFLSPVAATLNGYTVFTGDESICKRPVKHVVDVIKQLGSDSFVTRPDANGCPLVVKGPVKGSHTVFTEGSISSQYITGLMLAGCLMDGTLSIELSDPKETPYLTMTQKWLEKVGVSVNVSPDFKHISVEGPVDIKGFDCTIPSDWEGVAFPLIAALVSDSEVVIENVDSSGTQGDDAIVAVLQSIGSDIDWDKQKSVITVRGGKKSKNGIGRLTTENLKDKTLHVAMSDFPDAVCALAAIACFTEGTTVLEDAAVCRRKETDRLKVLNIELTKLGADIEEGEDYLIIHGHSPVLADGSANPDFKMHGGNVLSYLDHRMAMSLACLGLGLREGESVNIQDSECCSVSFPHFFELMNNLGAGYTEC